MRAALIDARAASLAALTVLVAAGALACTAHEDPPLPTPPSAVQPIVQELEPTPPPPPIVAPALAPLKPTRPLANLELRWGHDGDEPREDPLWTVGTRLVAMPNEAAAALGLAGPPELFIDSPLDTWTIRRAGPLVIQLENEGFTALKAGTGEARWSTPPVVDGRSYLHFIGERVLVAVYHRSAGDELVAWALEDSRRVWTREASRDPSFERIRALESDGDRGYFIGDAGLEAFDLITGKTLWTALPHGPNCGFAVAEGRVVIEDPGGHRVLDAANGTEQSARIGPATGHCIWSDYLNSRGVVAGGRLYTFETSPAAPHLAETLVVYDLDSGAEHWRSAASYAASSLVVDHDAAYLMRDGQTLVALDAETGAEVYRYGIGTWFTIDVEPVGGEAGPLVLVEGDYSGAWIFARGTEPTPLESWEIRGRLVSDGYLAKQRLRGVALDVDGQRVETDKRGRFVAKGSGRGVVVVETPEGDESIYDPETWTYVRVDSQRVELDGSGRYELGEVSAFEDYVE